MLKTSVRRILRGGYLLEINELHHPLTANCLYGNFVLVYNPDAIFLRWKPMWYNPLNFCLDYEERRETELLRFEKSDISISSSSVFDCISLELNKNYPKIIPKRVFRVIQEITEYCKNLL